MERSSPPRRVLHFYCSNSSGGRIACTGTCTGSRIACTSVRTCQYQTMTLGTSSRVLGGLPWQRERGGVPTGILPDPGSSLGSLSKPCHHPDFSDFLGAGAPGDYSRWSLSGPGPRATTAGGRCRGRGPGRPQPDPGSSPEGGEIITATPLRRS